VIRRTLARISQLPTGWLAACVIASVALLVAVAYRGVTEWEHSAALLAARRTDAAADQLVTVITRDMRGIQMRLLSSLRVDDASPDAPLDFNDISSAFARYPYAEAFFAGRGGADLMTFYSRADRPPPWLPKPDERTIFPVVLSADRHVGRQFLTRIEHSAAEGRSFATFDWPPSQGSHQVIARLTYRDSTPEQIESFVGFIVDLDWVRRYYFPELVAQVLKMQGPDAGLTMSVFDAAGGPVVATGGAAQGLSSTRQFTLLFFNPTLVTVDPPADLRRDTWTVRTALSNDQMFGAARVGARRTLSLAAVSALALAVGLVLTMQGVRTNARLSAMRSEFVSAVTHELKTPIATIRAACETLAAGRRVDAEMSREYAQLAVDEAKRLTRLIDNLLAYARITDLTEAYSFEALDVRTLAQQALKEFHSPLSAAGFSVDLAMPDDLPAVRADRPSMVLAIGNLIDNAIRYSSDRRELRISARVMNGSVIVEVADAGVGIPMEEIPHVTQRFFRGSSATAGGTGLGLSIAHRIVVDHGGSLSIVSESGVGTTVALSLPTAGVVHEEANLDS
jgi:signal transduction histidine kinase